MIPTDIVTAMSAVDVDQRAILHVAKLASLSPSEEEPARFTDQVAAILARIDARDKELSAFLTVDREDLLAQAAAVDAKRARGEALGPLAGVPIAIKDALCTRGVRTTAGSKILGDWKPPYDATAVARLRA